jgi:excisionase family DNA binding protein
MENVFLTSLTTPEVRQLFREELTKFFAENTPRQTIEDQPQKFSISELAEYLKCTKATIHTYKKRGIFKYYQTGRTIFFKKDEIDSALEVRNKKGVAK